MARIDTDDNAATGNVPGTDQTGVMVADQRRTVLRFTSTVPTARLAVLALMVGAVAVAHYSINPHAMVYHDILRRSMYLPIILAALWFRTGGGVAVALIAALLYAPHMYLQLHLTSDEEVDRVAEMFLYVVVGGLGGLLVEREHFHRRQTEEALTRLEQAHEDLRRQATQMGEIQDALRQVERLSTLGELAADLAHEVRNPLASIRGTAQILTGDPPPQDKLKFAKIVIDEVDRLNRVVDGYLHAARAGTVTGGRADAVAAVGSVIELTRRQAERCRVTVQRDGVDRLPVAMDMNRLTQVFMNLVLNAVQAMPRGGLLRVECQATPGSDGQPAWGEITFTDTGPGVAPENHERIFRPFFTTKPSGTGLGLSIARRLVNEHAGSLTLEASGGQGCVFRIRLPLIAR